MQSEFACHIGLRGKFFCRNCWVKGKDAGDNEGGLGDDSGDESDDGENEEAPPKKKRRKQLVETFQVLSDRLRRFMKVSHLASFILHLFIALQGPSRWSSSQRNTCCTPRFFSEQG